jgi:hypothetical protein
VQTAFAFSPLAWLYSVGAEVFALNNFAAAALVVLVLRYARDPSHTNVLVGALFCGVALCNQHTIVLYEIPCILWILFTRRKVCVHVCACVCACVFACVYVCMCARV